MSSDLLQAVDSGEVGVLVLLDLSAAFDTVDHNILLRRLSETCGLSGVVLEWFTSYLTGRTQYIRHNGIKLSVVDQDCVPQGSVLGPLLFTLYTADVALLAYRHGLNIHCMLMIHRYTARANPDNVQSYRVVCLPAWMMCARGCSQIVCN